MIILKKRQIKLYTTDDLNAIPLINLALINHDFLGFDKVFKFFLKNDFNKVKLLIFNESIPIFIKTIL